MKTALKNGLMLALAAFLFTATASAQMPQASDSAASLKKLEAEGGKFDFIGNAYGLDGWILIPPSGEAQYIYTTADGAMIKGTLYAPDGSSVTQRQLKAYYQKLTGGQAATPGAEASGVKSEQLYAAAEKASWIALGAAQAPYLYVFINANCGHCRDFWLDIAPQVDAGRLQVRLIPFGEAVANRQRGAALLSAADPAAAWKAWVNGDATAVAPDKIKDGALQRIDANTALVKQWRLPEPPFTVYRRPADGVVAAIIGRPENKLLLPSEFLK